MMIHNTVRAKFIKRPNRFIAHVELNGEEVIVHVPNTGRCREILLPDSTVVLRKATNLNRKTEYDLIGGYKEDMFINIDSQIPNGVVEEALKNKKIPILEKYSNMKREKTFGKSRFDFKLWDDEENEYYLEIKGVTFENNGKCMFPDAPTDRGTKHLLELIEVKKAGKGAGVLFLIQLNDAKVFSPYEKMDEKFARTLRLAKENGVDIFAYDCEVGENHIQLNNSVKIVL